MYYSFCSLGFGECLSFPVEPEHAGEAHLDSSFFTVRVRVAVSPLLFHQQLKNVLGSPDSLPPQNSYV